MSYEWITPKTDWTTTTRFEYTDYNRIRNNLLYINDMLNELYPDKAQSLDLGDAKTGYANEYAVSEFNAFEDALQSFTRVGQDVNIGDRNYYRGNDSFIWADALNRLEQCCLRWKEVSIIQATSIDIIPKKAILTYGEPLTYDVVVMPTNATHKDSYETTKEGIGTLIPSMKHYFAGYESGIANIAVSVDNVSDMMNIKAMMHEHYFCSGVVVYDDKIHVLGGRDGFNNHAVWNNDTYTWEELDNIPISIMSSNIIVYNNEIHLLGNDYGVDARSAVHYKWDGHNWSLLSNLPAPWSGACSVVYNNELHLLGGIYVYNNSRYENKHLKWNGSVWSEVSTLPSDVRLISDKGKFAVVYNNEIHIISNGKHYKWNGSTWSIASTLPISLTSCSLVVYDNKIHLIGGQKVDMSDVADDRRHHYTWDGNTWVKKTDLRFNFWSGTAVVLNDKIIALDGCNRAGNGFSLSNAKNMFIIDP